MLILHADIDLIAVSTGIPDGDLAIAQVQLVFTAAGPVVLAEVQLAIPSVLLVIAGGRPTGQLATPIGVIGVPLAAGNVAQAVPIIELVINAIALAQIALEVVAADAESDTANASVQTRARPNFLCILVSLLSRDPIGAAKRTPCSASNAGERTSKCDA
ncbi:hypothetical protein MNO14_14445 [Luteimonas sp. S4-F44]|uniref:hypothetical protein n=1 Tax=Luteimonas sp. S4-F44 TaxID=2925842 RepID=UPI001F539EB3|nr:hypothetical protein [Luteimonas sp. S4-F44]UNK42126.1 hypothetical protein MNO14_14445 [Luteimonas sp. S4-F44]